MSARDFGDERIEAAGEEFFAWYPGGVYDSALIAAIEKSGAAPVVTTRRKTVVKLRELAG